jgi:hypothetical protein
MNAKVEIIEKLTRRLAARVDSVSNKIEPVFVDHLRIDARPDASSVVKDAAKHADQCWKMSQYHLKESRNPNLIAYPMGVNIARRHKEVSRLYEDASLEYERAAKAFQKGDIRDAERMAHIADKLVTKAELKESIIDRGDADARSDATKQERNQIEKYIAGAKAKFKSGDNEMFDHFIRMLRIEQRNAKPKDAASIASEITDLLIQKRNREGRDDDARSDAMDQRTKAHYRKMVDKTKNAIEQWKKKVANATSAREQNEFKKEVDRLEQHLTKLNSAISSGKEHDFGGEYAMQAAHGDDDDCTYTDGMNLTENDYDYDALFSQPKKPLKLRGFPLEKPKKFEYPKFTKTGTVNTKMGKGTTWELEKNNR